MNDIIIGRDKEVKILEKVLASPRPEFVAVVGRRRIGKTFMIKNTYQKQLDFELTGMQYGNKSDQLQGFIYALESAFPLMEIKEKPRSWLAAFHALSKALEGKNKKEKEKMVVFLDELPWLATKKSGFITGLSWFWNSWAVNKNIVLVICGSAASWMIDKIINDRGGLHNRVTELILLQPFSLAETEAFMKSRNIRLNRYQIAQIYMAMGGVPMYLDRLKPGLSAVQNIQEICFLPSGYLRNEFDRLFASLFENSEKHVDIVRALASKRMGMSRAEIIAKTKFTNGGMLTAVLNELHQSGFIEIYADFGKRKQMSIYRLNDPYSLFYLTFIEKVTANKKIDFTRLSDLPNYKSWSGYAFENLCFGHIGAIRKALGISGIFTSISSFVAKPKDGLSGAQIDLLIDSDQSINLCEIKFAQSDYTLSKSDVKNLENKKQVFRYHTKSKKHIFTTLITTFGVTDNANRLNHVDQTIVLDDLFEV